MNKLACLALAAIGLSLMTFTAQAEPPRVEAFLSAGTLKQGDDELSQRLLDEPSDQQARFGLGVLRFIRAVERLAQAEYRHGVRNRAANMNVPFLRIPLPVNPEPEKLSYAQARRVLQTFLDDLAQAEKTLSEVRGEVKLPLHFGRLRLDLDGNGQATEDEALWNIFVRLNPAARGIEREQVEQFQITFDTADVAWLRGYCHLLSALGEIVLAHDMQDLFERTAHLFFPRPETPYDFLLTGPKVIDFFNNDLSDIIALIHLIHWRVAEPERMRAAHGHLLQVLELSRVTWRALAAETDDDREWIPSTKQTGVIPGISINAEMAEGWQAFLNEAEAILQGKKLLPFWRSPDGRGINLRRVFHEPQTLDLVLWIQGSGAAPFLEVGPRTEIESWRELNDAFGGQFVGFALWFN